MQLIVVCDGVKGHCGVVHLIRCTEQLSGRR